MNKGFKILIAAFAFLAVFSVCGSPSYAKGQTVYKGVDYSAIYDYDYYLENNPDLRGTLGDSQNSLLRHFVEFGMKEGRSSSPDFELWVYRAANPDLRTVFGNNKKEYYIHYKDYGVNEDRIAKGPYKIANPKTATNGFDFSGIYDFEYYYSHHKDVADAYGYDDEALLFHFVNYGMYENRQAKEDVTSTDGEYINLMIKYRPYRARETRYPKAAALLNGGDLRKAFELAHSIPYFGHNDQMPSDPVWTIEQFADFGFDNQKGNCYVMAAMFYEMAYILGYNPRQMAGWVPSISRGITQHSWIEIDMDGQTWVFDPNFTYATKNDGFKFKYGTKGTWKYQNYAQMLN